MIKLYGIKNCDTVKKARKWLESRAIDYQFHDFRLDGIDKALVEEWNQPWDVLLNRRGTTWRQLSEAEKQELDTTTALALMLRNPTLIKRPVLMKGTLCLVGFSDPAYATLFE